MTKRICVYCGALPGNNPAYRKAANKIGQLFASNNICLVYGGGRVGLMGEVADSALSAGVHIIGIIPESLYKRELAHNRIQDLRVVKSMHERKALMEELSSGFLALPGGFGTFEEILEMITWLQLGAHSKACGFLNIDGYYSNLLQFFDHAVTSGFITREDRQLVLDDDDPERLLQKILSYKAPKTTKWLAIDQT